jgi:hypothetical protein
MSKKNFQVAVVKKLCRIPIDEEEMNCIGYKPGSHGDCEYRGTGNEYENCYNQIILGGSIKI